MEAAMKKVRDVIVALLILFAVGWGVVSLYRQGRNNVHANLAKRMAELSPRGGPPETIDGLKAAIAAYEAQIELNVKEGAQTGVYWKILALRLADRGMHRDALDALEKAIYYNSEDASLFFFTGDYASIVAAATVGFSGNSTAEKEHFTRLAENSYLRAIQLDPVYTKPLLGLGILYTFDLNRPDEAIPYMERYHEISPSEIRGMFVLARAYFMTQKYDSAINMYDKIIAKTKDQKIKAEAENNKETIRNIIYG
jgi:tetratricopeptide (TPR) repeat protein